MNNDFESLLLSVAAKKTAVRRQLHQLARMQKKLDRAVTRQAEAVGTNIRGGLTDEMRLLVVQMHELRKSIARSVVEAEDEQEAIHGWLGEKWNLQTVERGLPPRKWWEYLIG